MLECRHSTDQTQKMSHKKRKALIRKGKRKANRQAKAQKAGPDKEISVSESEDEAVLLAAEVEKQRQHELWLEREKKAQEEWLAQKEREKREAQRKLEMEQKIREEWEERQKREKEEEEEREKREQERKDKQDELLKEATANENKDAWHNPLAPSQFGRERPECPFFLKTGACRFAERCSRTHTMPESSCTLMFPGMFANFRLEQSLVDENDADDLALEYDDNEMYQNFTDFYHDVLPEFRSAGRVTQFKVSSNCEPHLRGNVYVQFKNEESAQKAFMKFNGRWYGGRQLSCGFVNINKWKSAICGLAFNKRCPKGKSCNFLHVFRNPSNEFWQADKDIDPSDRHRDSRFSDHRESRHRYGSELRERRSEYRDHNDEHDRKYCSRRYRSRSRSPNSRWKRRKRSRSRSRSRSPYSKSRSRKRSRSRSPKIQSQRSRSRSRSHSRYRLQHRSRSHSRSPSKSRGKRSQSFSKENKPSSKEVAVALSVRTYSNGTKKANDSDYSSDSDSDTNKSNKTSGSSSKHKKTKKAKKHKHKHKHKKSSRKTNRSVTPDHDAEDKATVEPNVIEIPQDNSDVKAIAIEILQDNSDVKVNVIEIPQDNSDDDLGSVIFEDVFV